MTSALKTVPVSYRLRVIYLISVPYTAANWTLCCVSFPLLARPVLTTSRGKSKVKCTLIQALRLCKGRTACRGSRGIALPFHDHGTWRGEGPASRPDRSLPLGKMRYPLYWRLGGPQGRSWDVRKISPPPGFDPRTVQLVASRYFSWHALIYFAFISEYITN